MILCQSLPVTSFLKAVHQQSYLSLKSHKHFIPLILGTKYQVIKVPCNDILHSPFFILGRGFLVTSINHFSDIRCIYTGECEMFYLFV